MHGTSRCSMLLYLHCYLLSYVSSATFVAQESVMGVTDLNVTGYVGQNNKLFEIVHEPSTWFESFYKCKQRGFNELINYRAGHKRVKSMNQVFREDNFYSPGNTSFWVGLFRPYLVLDRWFRAHGDVLTPKCDEFPSSIIDWSTGTKSLDQCAYLLYDDFQSPPHLISDNCSVRLPYICEVSEGKLGYNLYDGFDIRHKYELLEKTETNITQFVNCRMNCTHNFWCAGFSFYNDTNRCVVFIIIDMFYYYFTYSVTRVSANVTHGVKNATGFTATDSQILFENPKTGVIFPQCIPSGYCVKENTTTTTQAPLNLTQLEEQTEELVKNITIDPASTAKHRQRYESAMDGSSTSRAFGAIAVVVIVGVCSLPVIVDVITFIRHFDRRRVDKTTHCNRVRVRQSRNTQEDSV